MMSKEPRERGEDVRLNEQDARTNMARAVTESGRREDGERARRKIDYLAEHRRDPWAFSKKVESRIVDFAVCGRPDGSQCGRFLLRKNAPRGRRNRAEFEAQDNQVTMPIVRIRRVVETGKNARIGGSTTTVSMRFAAAGVRMHIHRTGTHEEQPDGKYGPAKTVAANATPFVVSDRGRKSSHWHSNTESGPCQALCRTAIEMSAFRRQFKCPLETP
jgi:hypothetical protein